MQIIVTVPGIRLALNNREPVGSGYSEISSLVGNSAATAGRSKSLVDTVPIHWNS